MPRGIPNNTSRPISAEASNKVIVDRIKTLGKQMKATDVEIQSIVCLIVAHATGVGNYDVTALKLLVESIPSTYRRAPLVNYINLHTMMRITTDTKDKGKFKASVKNEESVTRADKERSKMKEPNATVFSTKVGLSWEQTSALVNSKDEAGNFNAAFYQSAEAQRDPELMSVLTVDTRIVSLADQIKRRIENPVRDGKDQIKKDDIPSLRALEAALRLVHKNYKEGKIKPINDDNTLGDAKQEPKEDVETSRRTGTDG